jgi:soluble lytic murein transglycosylase-like protein
VGGDEVIEELRNYVEHYAVAFNLKPELIQAIILRESDNNQYAMRYEPNWQYLTSVKRFAGLTGTTEDTERMGQSISWGLMQVMGTCAREMGFVGSFPELCVIETNLYYGCLKLSQLLKKYENLKDAISAYNSGCPVKKLDGSYKNQGYVDTVLQLMSAIAEARK